MGMLGTWSAEPPLECPECGGKVLWNGSKHVCFTCPWKEQDARPPSDPKMPVVQTNAHPKEK